MTITKILCSDLDCGKWLARREDQQVIFYCPRCKTETPVEVVDLLRELAQWLVEMEIQYASVIQARAEASGKVGTGPLSGRVLVGGGRRKSGGGSD